MRAGLKNRSWLRHFTLLVICFFVVMLGYALYKLTELQSDLGRDTGENMVWSLSQSSYQTSRLLLAMADEQSSAAEIERLQAMIVASVRLLTQGRPRDFMQEAGVWPDVQRVQQALAADDVDYFALQREFQRIGGLIMVAERNLNGEQRDAQRHVVMQIMMASLGMLLAGMMLCCQLFLSLTHARAARLEISRQHAQAKALLDTLQRERSVRLRYRDFVSLMSHQLRTPLAVIDSSAQRLLRRHTLEEQDISQRSQRIRTAVAQLNRLIERVLDGMRGDEGGEDERSSLCRTRCYWRDVIDDVLERLGDTLGSRQIVRRGEDIWVTCDRMWCVEILINLISNAHKYGPQETPIEVISEVREQVLYCTIRDYGQGIAAEDRSRIFERFYRGEQSTRSSGLGLGLPIARMLAQWQGGDVGLADGGGPGTAFIVQLPLIGQVQSRVTSDSTQATM